MGYMANETDTESGLFGRLKGLIPRRHFRPSLAVSTSQLPEEPVAAKQEQTAALTPFQQVEQLLERVSGIVDPYDKGIQRTRRIKIEKKLYNPVYRQLREKDPVYITVSQKPALQGGGWNGTIEISIVVLSAQSIKDYNEKHNLHGVPEPRNLEGKILLSDQEPKLRIKYMLPKYDDAARSIWDLMNLQRPRSEYSQQGWIKDATNRSYPWSTNDERELASVASFVTTGETFYDPPQVVRK